MSNLTIAKSYWRSIKRGTKTFEQVPEALKADVKMLAREDASTITIDGVISNITAEQYEQYIGEPYEEDAT